VGRSPLRQDFAAIFLLYPRQSIAVCAPCPRLSDGFCSRGAFAALAPSLQRLGTPKEQATIQTTRKISSPGAPFNREPIWAGVTGIRALSNYAVLRPLAKPLLVQVIPPSKVYPLVRIISMIFPPPLPAIFPRGRPLVLSLEFESPLVSGRDVNKTAGKIECVITSSR